MTQASKIAKQLGLWASQNPHGAATTLKTQAVAAGLTDQFELLPLWGVQTGHIMPVIHNAVDKGLLLWCGLLDKVVDLAKIKPGTRSQLRCHNVMLEHSRAVRLAEKQPGGWAADLTLLEVGDFGPDWCRTLAEMVSKIHLAPKIEQQVFREIMERHYQEAI